MASYIDNMKITTGIDTNTTLDLSSQHVTTTDWMHSQPVYIKEMVPGESIKVHSQVFTRLAPMAVPTMGRGSIHTRAFFVPMRTIMKTWNEFITSSLSNSQAEGALLGTPATGIVSNVPLISNLTLLQVLLGSSLTGATNWSQAYTGTDHNCDIVLRTVSSGGVTTDTEFNLLPAGRRFLKIIQSLGYNPIWYWDARTTYTDIHYSALPLLAWLRIILDWYYPSQYIGDYYYYYAKFIVDNTVTYGAMNSIAIDATTLQTIFSPGSSIFNGIVSYDSDYFVSAFDNPMGSVYGFDSNVSIRDINLGGSTMTQEGKVYTPGSVYQSGTVALNVNQSGNTAGAGKTTTQYALDALKALTDYVKRHQLVGARAVDRLYARFGKVLDSAKMDRSMYLGGANADLQIGDVMSHATSGSGSGSSFNGATLGDYAGKGLGFGDGNFEFSTEEYGYIIVVSSLIPKVCYYQGTNRNNMHINRLDFWTPEFDQLGNQAMAKNEVFCPMNIYKEIGSSVSADDWLKPELKDGIFGYVPRYAEYKVGFDNLTGDFRLGSKNGAGFTSDAWHMYRGIGKVGFADIDNMKHNSLFTSGYDYDQYNRIFNYTGGSADKFVMIYNFDVQSQSPMHSLYDTYKFENEDEGAKKVTADVNGVKVN